MVDGRGRPAGHPKTGGAKKGSVKTNTKQVKDTIKAVFYDDLGGAKYLRKIAKEDPALFTSLLAKLIPSEIRSEISVTHNLDLGLAMQQASQRVSDFYDAQNTITHAPTREMVISPSPVLISNGSEDV